MSQSFVDIQVTNSIILALDMLYNLIGVCVCVVGLGLDRPRFYLLVVGGGECGFISGGSRCS